MFDRGPYWYNPQPKIRFRTREERDAFKRRVETAVAMYFGMRSVGKFLAEVLVKVAELAPEEQTVTIPVVNNKKKKHSVKEFLTSILR